jgi:hypothetical protein
MSAETRAAPNSAAEILPLRIEAATLLDEALRLKYLLAKRKAGLRIVRRIKDFTHTSLGRPVKERKLDEDAKRYAAVLLKSGLFDPEYYLRRNPDVAAAGVDPVVHYLQYGASELRNPSPYFSTRWYLRRYVDVAASEKNPLYHFIVSGYREGRLPLPKNPSDLFATDPTPDRSSESLVFGTVIKPAPTTTAEDKGQSAATAAASSARLVVYTSMFGNYDDLFVPSPEQAQGCDFVVFTDQPDIPLPWRRGSIEYTAPCRARRSRFYKLLPHRLFPQYEWSLYLDANVDLMNAIGFFERYRDLGPDFFVFRHPSRTNILEELGACIGLKKDDAGVMVRQVAQYLEGGFSQSFQLTENNVLLRRHNDPELADLNEAWWDEVRSKSRRDQLSLSYVVERKNYRKLALLEQGRVTARNCPGIRVRPHRAQFHTPKVLDHVLP